MFDVQFLLPKSSMLNGTHCIKEHCKLYISHHFFFVILLDFAAEDLQLKIRSSCNDFTAENMHLKIHCSCYDSMIKVIFC